MPGCITRLDPIDVMYVREFEKPDEEAFAELESCVDSFDYDGRSIQFCCMQSVAPKKLLPPCHRIPRRPVHSRSH